jgi:hypothetical protein
MYCNPTPNGEWQTGVDWLPMLAIVAAENAFRTRRVKNAPAGRKLGYRNALQATALPSCILTAQQRDCTEHGQHKTKQCNNELLAPGPAGRAQDLADGRLWRYRMLAVGHQAVFLTV